MKCEVLYSWKNNKNCCLLLFKCIISTGDNSHEMSSPVSQRSNTKCCLLLFKCHLILWENGIKYLLPFKFDDLRIIQFELVSVRYLVVCLKLGCGMENRADQDQMA